MGKTLVEEGLGRQRGMQRKREGEESERCCALNQVSNTNSHTHIHLQAEEINLNMPLVDEEQEERAMAITMGDRMRQFATNMFRWVGAKRGK